MLAHPGQSPVPENLLQYLGRNVSVICSWPMHFDLGCLATPPDLLQGEQRPPQVRSARNAARNVR